MRAIPDDNLAYPVLVTLDSGETGSGFYLNTANAVLLITARHVLYKLNSNEMLSPKVTLLSYSKDPSETDRNVFALDMNALLALGAVKPHPVGDIAVVQIAATIPGLNSVKVLPGVTVLSKAPSGVLGVSAAATTKTYDQVLVANEIYIFGYPTSLGLKNIPQIDYSRPLLRKGIVAGKNDKHRTIILDCPVYPGNSGGPVLEADHVGLQIIFRVIGVISEFIPAAEVWLNTTHGYTNTSIANSGYSVAVPMDLVLELKHEFENIAAP